jgi:hypothetical protein
MARQAAGRRPREFDSAHELFVTAPRELAGLLLDIAESPAA